MDKILSQIAALRECNVIFCDFFDTIVHRKVHPNYVIRLWSKFMIREFGLNLKIDELYHIRKDSEIHLSSKNKKHSVEISYQELIKEIYNRLVCTNNLKQVTLEKFSNYFELLDYRSEITVQYLNADTVEILTKLKNEGYEIFCISDFYTSLKVLRKFMVYHKIQGIFKNIFVSSEYHASKHNADLYPLLLKKLKLQPENVVMLGDNYTSDIKNARQAGINTVHLLKNLKHSKTNLKSAMGSDYRDYRKLVRGLYKKCNHKLSPPNSDYILFYTIYIERLYYNVKKRDIKNILFLSREGLYLKKLFDSYQEYVAVKKEDFIGTHYLRTSRQASMLVSLKRIEEESFTFLRNKYPHLSVQSFLKNFNFTEKEIDLIIQESRLQKEKNNKINNFLDSEVFKKLLNNSFFTNAYDKKRLEQKSAFKKYLQSFGLDFYKEGMYIADIGWGGSMQERLYDFFEGKVKVHGYYLGLREIYDIRKKTKRFGLNFSVFPYATYSDNILRGNIELSEQLLSAPHGSAICYDTSKKTFTHEYHHEEEKRIYEEYISDIQSFMFERFRSIVCDFERICYDSDIVQKEMTDYALRIGIFASKRKIASAMNISKGFYTNVGDFSSGLTIGTSKTRQDLPGILKTLVLTPDKLFRYLLRIKPYLYTRNVYFAAYLLPSYLIYKYLKLNIWLRKSFVSKMFYLKYAHLR